MADRWGKEMITVAQPVRVYATVAALTALLSTTACGNDSGDGAQRASVSSAPVSSSPTGSATEPVTLRSCVVAEPREWAAAIERSTIDTGGVSTEARAVTRGGDVLAVRDNGQTRDLILIQADGSVRELYAVPDPDTFNIGYAGIDDRWIVFALERIPRNANGVLPTIKRIEVMDRADGSIRTVAAQSEADQAVIPELNVLDSVALHDGRVYWLTTDTYTSDTGTVRSFDPMTGATEELAAGPMRDLRAGAGGVSWARPGPGPSELKVPAELPGALAGVVAESDRVSLSTDGAAYGWIVGSDEGGTGVGYWSPATGVVTVTGLALRTDAGIPPVFVNGPFVLLGKGLGGDTDSSGIVVDTRSGAAAGLVRRPDAQYDMLVDAYGGALAIDVSTGTGKGVFRVGVLGPDALAPLAC